MRSSLGRLALQSFLIAAAIRLSFTLLPGDFFPHVRELVEFPGYLAKGLSEAVFHVLGVGDPPRYTQSIDDVGNFLCTYLLVFGVYYLFQSKIDRSPRKPTA